MPNLVPNPRHLAGIFLLASSLAPALGASTARPLLVAQRDAALVYHLSGGAIAAQHAPPEVDVAVQGGSGRLRLSAPGRAEIAIADPAARSVDVVVPAARTVLHMPLQAGAFDFLTNPDAGFRRLGTRRVAGLPCTDWQVFSPHGTTPEGTACITADGILLAGQTENPNGPKGGQLEAVSVQFAPQPSAFFAPPPGFSRADVPAAAANGLPPGLANLLPKGLSLPPGMKLPGFSAQ